MERLRLKYDESAALGVPAHVTILYPIMARENVTAAIANEAVRKLSRFTCFDFSLVSISRWSEVTYLVPEPSAPFVAMTRALARSGRSGGRLEQSLRGRQCNTSGRGDRGTIAMR